MEPMGRGWEFREHVLQTYGFVGGGTGVGFRYIPEGFSVRLSPKPL